MPNRFHLASSSISTGAFALLAAFVVSGGASGCGRSDLADYAIASSDGGPEGGDDSPNDSPDDFIGDEVFPDGGCSPSTCPEGCCDAEGLCEKGTAPTNCGIGGLTCQDCLAEGFNTCDPAARQCTIKVSGCGPTNCPGCCNGDLCTAGNSNGACGTGGENCFDCSLSGTVCENGACQASTCNAANCKGCCFINTCQPDGTLPTSCGPRGAQCMNCVALGETCTPTGMGGGICTGTPSCGPTNCSGCCEGEICVGGTSPTECGGGGAQCQDCMSFGETCLLSPGGPLCAPSVCGPGNCKGCCQGQMCVVTTGPTACGVGGESCTDCQVFGETCNATGQCVPPPPLCTPANCAGCCDLNGVCQPGFVNVLCGENGASCQNCTAIGSTCDDGVTPRTCQSEQMQCPSPYAGCSAGLMEPPPVTENVCSANDLANGAAACQFGANTAGCVAFFQFEKAQRPSCAACLAPFDYDFSQSLGLINCAVPFLGTACNHELACLVNCVDSTCAGCQGQAAISQCQSQAPTTECLTYEGGVTCVDQAIGSGPGSFCAPTGDYGTWLQTVGTHYCAN